VAANVEAKVVIEELKREATVFAAAGSRTLRRNDPRLLKESALAKPLVVAATIEATKAFEDSSTAALTPSGTESKFASTQPCDETTV
jgi:hypothetical protein